MAVSVEQKDGLGTDKKRERPIHFGNGSGYGGIWLCIIRAGDSWIIANDEPGNGRPISRIDALCSFNRSPLSYPSFTRQWSKGKNKGGRYLFCIGKVWS